MGDYMPDDPGLHELPEAEYRWVDRYLIVDTRCEGRLRHAPPDWMDPWKTLFHVRFRMPSKWKTGFDARTYQRRQPRNTAVLSLEFPREDGELNALMVSVEQVEFEFRCPVCDDELDRVVGAFERGEAQSFHWLCRDHGRFRYGAERQVRVAP